MTIDKSVTGILIVDKMSVHKSCKVGSFFEGPLSPFLQIQLFSSNISLRSGPTQKANAMVSTKIILLGTIKFELPVNLLKPLALHQVPVAQMPI